MSLLARARTAEAAQGSVPDAQTSLLAELSSKPWCRRGWTREQLRSHWPHLTLQQVELLKEVFQLFDLEDKGFFTKDDLFFVMEAMGGSPTPQELDAVLYELDSNGDAVVDFPEFLTKFLNATDEHQLLAVFDQLAIQEGDGPNDKRMLTLTAVERSFQYVGDPLSEEDKRYLQIIFDGADKDGNGRLDIKEFTAYLEKMDDELFMGMGAAATGGPAAAAAALAGSSSLALVAAAAAVGGGRTSARGFRGLRTRRSMNGDVEGGGGGGEAEGDGAAAAAGGGGGGAPTSGSLASGAASAAAAGAGVGNGLARNDSGGLGGGGQVSLRSTLFKFMGTGRQRRTSTSSASALGARAPGAASPIPMFGSGPPGVSGRSLFGAGASARSLADDGVAASPSGGGGGGGGGGSGSSMQLPPSAFAAAQWPPYSYSAQCPEPMPAGAAAAAAAVAAARAAQAQAQPQPQVLLPLSRAGSSGCSATGGGGGGGAAAGGGGTSSFASATAAPSPRWGSSDGAANPSPTRPTLPHVASMQRSPSPRRSPASTNSPSEQPPPPALQQQQHQQQQLLGPPPPPPLQLQPQQQPGDGGAASPGIVGPRRMFTALTSRLRGTQEPYSLDAIARTSVIQEVPDEGDSQYAAAAAAERAAVATSPTGEAHAAAAGAAAGAGRWAGGRGALQQPPPAASAASAQPAPPPPPAMTRLSSLPGRLTSAGPRGEQGGASRGAPMRLGSGGDGRLGLRFGGIVAAVLGRQRSLGHGAQARSAGGASSPTSSPRGSLLPTHSPPPSQHGSRPGSQHPSPQLALRPPLPPPTVPAPPQPLPAPPQPASAELAQASPRHGAGAGEGGGGEPIGEAVEASAASGGSRSWVLPTWFRSASSGSARGARGGGWAPWSSGWPHAAAPAPAGQGQGQHEQQSPLQQQQPLQQSACASSSTSGAAAVAATAAAAVAVEVRAGPLAPSRPAPALPLTSPLPPPLPLPPADASPPPSVHSRAHPAQSPSPHPSGSLLPPAALAAAAAVQHLGPPPPAWQGCASGRGGRGLALHNSRLAELHGSGPGSSCLRRCTSAGVGASAAPCERGAAKARLRASLEAAEAAGRQCAQRQRQQQQQQQSAAAAAVAAAAAQACAAGALCEPQHPQPTQQQQQRQQHWSPGSRPPDAQHAAPAGAEGMEPRLGHSCVASAGERVGLAPCRSNSTGGGGGPGLGAAGVYMHGGLRHHTVAAQADAAAAQLLAHPRSVQLSGGEGVAPTAVGAVQPAHGGPVLEAASWVTGGAVGGAKGMCGSSSCDSSGGGAGGGAGGGSARGVGVLGQGLRPGSSAPLQPEPGDPETAAANAAATASGGLPYAVRVAHAQNSHNPWLAGQPAMPAPSAPQLPAQDAPNG